MMGGMVTIQSKLGEGSIFTFIFPQVVSGTTVNYKIVSTSENNLNQYVPSKILVVDDIESNRELIKGYLVETHHTLIFAENGEEAISLTKLHHPDLILLDLRMPKMDGKEVLICLKQDENTKNIPIVILTAESQKEEQSELKKLCQGFLGKPVSYQQFVAEIKNHFKLADLVNHTRNTQSIISNIPNSTLLIFPQDLTDLFSQLDAEEKVWLTLKQTLKIRELEQFVKRLENLATKHNCQELLEHVKHLRIYLNTFDIEKISHIINDFPSIKQTITQKYTSSEA